MGGRRRYSGQWVWWVWMWAWWSGWSVGKVIPPRWVNATLNPCSTKSWQLLYWPQDHSCYRIFTQGPCGETQEFYFDPREGKGACRCPRGTLFYPATSRCYPHYSRGPCSPRQYLDTDEAGKDGRCWDFDECPPRHVFWPRTKECYQYHTRGPCLKGYLIYVNPNTGVPGCGCDRNVMFSNYWSLTGLCFELFQRGPCLGGKIFLYNATKGATECSCSASIITNYDRHSDGCYELNTQGPCNPGQIFTFDPAEMITQCHCRDDHALWPENGHCYPLYSRGPCDKGHFFTPVETSKMTVIGECRVYPCSGTQRYHPTTDKCFRLGWQGPCPEGNLFIYDEDSPLRGTCGCTSELVGYWQADSKCYELGSRGPCEQSQIMSYNKVTGGVKCSCDIRKGFVKWHDEHCYRLETRGPCSAGQMLAVKHWRPLTPICTSHTSILMSNNPPLIFGEMTSKDITLQHHHESNSVTTSHSESIYTIDTLNDTLAINASTSQPTEEQPQHKTASNTTHREGRQLRDRPAPTNIYSLGEVGASLPTENKNTQFSLGRSGRSMGDTETWGFLDDTYFDVPGEPTDTYYTGRADGQRSFTPWWGAQADAT